MILNLLIIQVNYYENASFYKTSMSTQEQYRQVNLKDFNLRKTNHKANMTIEIDMQKKH